MKRRRLIRGLLCFLAFALGAIIGVTVAFQGAGRGADGLPKIWTGIVVYPVILLDESVGPIPGALPFVIVVALAGLIPGLFCLFVMRLFLNKALPAQ